MIDIPARVVPQLAHDLERVDADLLPPCPLISESMNLPMMDPAQGSHEFIAHLAAEGTRLREPQVMGIARFSPTHRSIAGVAAIAETEGGGLGRLRLWEFRQPQFERRLDKPGIVRRETVFGGDPIALPSALFSHY